jgi:glycosyltransferase involved in cell wall biosynthesis
VTAHINRPLNITVNGWWLRNTAVGIGVYLKRLLEVLQQRDDLRLTVAVPRSLPHPIELPERIEAFTLRAMSVGHPLLDEVLWDQAVARFVRKRPQSIYFSPCPSWLLRPPKQVVCCIHDCIPHIFPAYMGRSGIRQMVIERRERATRHIAQAVVTESNHARTDLVEKLKFRHEQIEVIPAWLPKEFSSPIPEEQIASVRERYRLPLRFWLYVGGYDVRKNINLLLHCYSRLGLQDNMPSLVLAGRIPTDISKPVCDVYGKLSSLSLPEGAVIMPGFIEDEDLPAIYAGAELFIYPSFYEGFGLPPMEAMGCGCPAIVADNSSLPEVVTDADYRFNAENPDALTTLLARAANVPMPLNPGFTPEQFNADAAARDYVNLFRTVLCA